MAKHGTLIRIGVLTLVGRPYHHAMSNMLNLQINGGVQGIYQYSLYRCLNDKEIVKARVRQMVFEDGCELIIAVGEVCFLAATEVAFEIGGLPIIFVGVGNPKGRRGIDSLEKPGFTITGVSRDKPSPQKVAHNIGKLYPNVKSMLIPFLPEAAQLQEELSEIKTILEPKMKIFLVPIKETPESFMAAVEEYKDKIQAVFIAEGCFSNQFQEELAYKCWKNCIVSIGSNPTALDAGFCCAFAGDLSKLAAEVYKIMRLHCEEGVPLGNIPVVVLPDDRKFVVNIDMLRRIDFSAESLQRICLYDDTTPIREWINMRKDLLKPRRCM